MNSHIYSSHSSPNMKHLLNAAHAALDQQPPPSLREILTAYRTKGDGDRDMLLAMLNAKTAEDQRLASVASLHRTLLDIYQLSPAPSPPETHSYPRAAPSVPYHYPPPQNYAQQPRDQAPSRRVHHRHRASSRSRSPPGHRIHSHPHLPPPSRDTRDMNLPHHADPHPRKRHRSSRSPHVSHAAMYESSHPSEQFPPSPYSSSDRSDSAEYSPHSRNSMNIGSLLSSGPSRDINGDIQSQDRDRD